MKQKRILLWIKMWVTEISWSATFRRFRKTPHIINDVSYRYNKATNQGRPLLTVTGKQDWGQPTQGTPSWQSDCNVLSLLLFLFQFSDKLFLHLTTRLNKFWEYLNINTAYVLAPRLQNCFSIIHASVSDLKGEDEHTANSISPVILK